MNAPLEFVTWEGDNSELQPGYNKITRHMIFEVKMGEKFRRFFCVYTQDLDSGVNDLLVFGVKGLSLNRADRRST